VKMKMRKLVYWVAPILDDFRAYSIRAKTRRDVKAIMNGPNGLEAQYYGKIRKVVVAYRDTHDLLFQALGEGSIDEGGNE
jgi:hypothetical protein